MKINKERIKQEAIKFLEKGEKIEIRWDAGNDDCIFEYYLNTHQINCLTDWQEKLATYIMIELELPGVGEYCVLGEAELLLKNGFLFLKYLNKDNEHILEIFGDDEILREEEEFDYYKDNFMGEEEEVEQREEPTAVWRKFT